MSRSDEKYSLLIEKMPDAFAYHQVLTDEDGKPVDYIFLEVNSAFEEMTGLKREEINGKKVTEVLPGIENSEFDWIGTYGKVASSGEPVRFESYSEPLGRWYEVCAYSDEQGFFATVFRDINAEKVKSAKLRRSEKGYKYIVNNIPDMVVRFDTNLRHIYLNRTAEKFIGPPADFIAGKTFLDLVEISTSEEQRKQFKKMHETLKKCLDSGEEQQDIYTFPMPGGEKYLFTRIVPEKEKGGKIVSLLAVTTDITERKRLEQALAQSEERFQKMLSLVPDLISIHDTDMNIVYSNWNGFGAVPEEKRILNTKCYKTYRELNQICPDCRALKVLQTGEAFQKEVELPDGTWVDLRVIPIPGEDQTVEYFVEWVRDITDRKESEKELIAQHQLLEGIMDNVSDVLSIQYPDHTIERYNRAGYELLDMTPEEVSGKKCHQLIGRERECEECATAKALQSGKLEQVERYFPELGLHLHCRANPVFEDGKIVLLVQHLMDITKRKQVEEALRESEQTLDALMEHIPIGISIADRSGYRLRRVSRHGLELMGWPREQHEGLTVEEILSQWEVYEPDGITKADLEELPLIKAIARGEKVFGQELVQIHEDGRAIPLSCDAGPIKDSGGNIVGGIIAWQDITERKKFEEALKLQAAERAAVDIFTYSVSNDLQAPLRRIEGFSEALQEECADQLNDRASDYLDRIKTQVGSMKNLTDALLQLSRVVSREIDREPVDLSALTRSSLEKLKYKEPERQIKLTVEPNLIDEGDPELLKILLDNLLDNAWKFTSGVEEAKIEFGSVGQDGRTVYYLKDNGVGFDMNYADKLFIPFHKLHGEGEYPGIGIGLNLVYRIISRHGGEIWAEGEVGRGACIYFTLP